jgi:AraC-like DNA-binding protein
VSHSNPGGQKKLPAVMSHSKEQLEAGVAAYLAFCHRERTAARASELAGFLRVSYRNLTRIFNRVLGVPVGVAIRRRQLESAAHLLRETELPIDDIGLRVGFGDRRTFYRAIRREFGCSPATLRKDGPNLP